MLNAKDRIEELKGRKFRMSKNGLDEVEVSSLIESLINQNNDLIRKLERRGSAEEIAKQTKIEDGERKTIASAEQQAREVIRAAEERAEAIKGSARVEAGNIIAEAKKKSEV
ncbi:MAG: DivIVA domain-containing protein, partial [Dehalococcoidia bacterium]